MAVISFKDGIECITIESKWLSVVIVPGMGGKMLSIYNKELDKEFLWTNTNIPFKYSATGDEYDPNFLGAIDELLPNDIPETIDGINYPDHGELWTTPLQYNIDGDIVTVFGTLPLSGLFYSKIISLAADSPSVKLDYYIENRSGRVRHFLWKLHAALKINEGDALVTDAATAQVVDAAYTRFENQTAPFAWPYVGETDASVVPSKNNTMDFFYLYDIPRGEMQMEYQNDKTIFSYEYDQTIFPYQWYFASFGGFLDHYTAILEPCTTMPISVNEAIQQKQTAVLQVGKHIETSVTIYAGPKNNHPNK